MFRLSPLKNCFTKNGVNVTDLPLNLRKFREWVSDYSTFGEVSYGIDTAALKDMTQNMPPEDSLQFMQMVYNSSILFT